MTIEQRNFAFDETKKYDDVEIFVQDMLSSKFFSYNEEASSELANELKTLWKISNGSFREFLDLIRRTQTEFSRRYHIPARTVRSWALEERECTGYLKLMVAEIEQIL